MGQRGSQRENRPVGRAGKVKDPLFVLMVVAMALAVGSSIALRAFVPGAGPSAARAEGTEGEPEAVLYPVRAHPVTTVPAAPLTNP